MAASPISDFNLDWSQCSTGDIILFQGSSDVASIIREPTGWNFSHVAIFFRDPDSSKEFFWQTSWKGAKLEDCDVRASTLSLVQCL